MNTCLKSVIPEGYIIACFNKKYLDIIWIPSLCKNFNVKNKANIFMFTLHIPIWISFLVW